MSRNTVIDVGSIRDLCNATWEESLNLLKTLMKNVDEYNELDFKQVLNEAREIDMIEEARFLEDFLGGKDVNQNELKEVVLTVELNHVKKYLEQHELLGDTDLVGILESYQNSKN